MIPYHEIVHVLDSHTLINREFDPCPYESPLARVLEAGFYIVMWPPLVVLRDYNGKAQFFGPFVTRTEAAKVLQRSVEDHYFADANESLH